MEEDPKDFPLRHLERPKTPVAPARLPDPERPGRKHLTSKLATEATSSKIKPHLPNRSPSKGAATVENRRFRVQENYREGHEAQQEDCYVRTNNLVHKFRFIAHSPHKISATLSTDWDPLNGGGAIAHHISWQTDIHPTISEVFVCSAEKSSRPKSGVSEHLRPIATSPAHGWLY